jgi:phosphoglycolate phosphatase-like HAD superfamily hydrolase
MAPKQTLYVSISSKSLDSEASRNEQLEVYGTEEELEELRQLLEQVQRDDEVTHFRAPIPYKSADHDQATDQFNDDLLKLYRVVYELGTAKTKEHIEAMNILTKLQDTDYDYPGYDR